MPDCGHAKLYAMDFANQPKAIYECLWCKLDKLQAENLGLAVRREEYDRTVELLVEAQEERDSLKVSLATATEERIAGRRNMQAEIDRLASKLEERTKLLRDVRKDLELRAEIKGDDSVVPLGNTLYARLVDATEPQ